MDSIMATLAAMTTLAKLKYGNLDPDIWKLIQRAEAMVENPPEIGWIVADSKGTSFRTWEDGMPIWTDDRTKATRYARRIDAENVHREDEDAWLILPYFEDQPNVG